MWGDGRMFILGTEGFIEQRKYMNIGTDDGPAHVYLANRSEETHFEVQGKVGYPFFGQFVLDCLERTDNAMTQEQCRQGGRARYTGADAGGGSRTARLTDSGCTERPRI